MEIDDIRLRLKKIICQRLNLDMDWQNLPDDYRVIDSGLGLDSIESLELIMGIEQDFGISISSHEIDGGVLSSLPNLVRFVSDLISLRSSSSQ